MAETGAVGARNGLMRGIAPSEAGKAVGLGGREVVRCRRPGLQAPGRTAIAQFIAAHPDLVADLPASALRVLAAVSANQSCLEAVDTEGPTILRFGCLRWGLGRGSARGELAALLYRLKADDPAAFQRHFGAYGLDVAASGEGRAYGHLVLAGKRLDTAARKARLRSLTWAWRFGRAGADPAVGRVQIRHAVARIGRFHACPRGGIEGRPIADHVRSEYGVALLLDQHVVRPRQVGQTLRRAASELADEIDFAAPEDWTTADEARLLDRYLAHRHQTSMPNSAGRAAHILASVRRGQLSDRRGSYAG